MQSSLTLLVDGFISNVANIAAPAVKAKAFDSLRALAAFHFAGVVDLLLAKPAPLSGAVLDSFRGLALPTERVDLSARTQEYLLTVLNETPVEEKVATPLVMTATEALTACFDIPETKAFVDAKYHPHPLIMRTCIHYISMRPNTRLTNFIDMQNFI